MTTLWNPRRLLDVDPDGPFTCVGITQKGKRCRNSFISNSDLTYASILLDDMARSHPWEAREHLTELAKITLCPRWHRKPGYSQVESKRREWWSIIISTYAEPRPTRQSTSTTTTSATLPSNTRQASSSNEAALRISGLLTPPPSPSPAPRLRIQTAPAAEVRRTTVPAEPTPRTPSSPSRAPATLSASSPTVSASPVTSATAAAAALVPLPASPEQEPAQPHRGSSTPSSPSSSTVSPLTTTSVPSSPARESSPRPRTPTPDQRPANTWLQLTPERPIQTPTPSCSHSSRRKPLVDECPICNEEMHCLDDAVWCRAQCGTNIHRACFAPWRTACMDRNAPVTCVYCRSQWKFEWEE